MSLEAKSNENEWILTSCTSSTINIEPKNKSNPLDSSNTLSEGTEAIGDFVSDESMTLSPENFAFINQELNSSNMSNSNVKLTSDTFKVLSKVNIDELSFKSKFELLFNDISMLKASAVQGILAKTNFRFLAWMIFLDCLPMDKSKWTESLNQHRQTYDKIKKEICCDPHKKNQTNELNFDHPLSQHQNSVWNRYFTHNQMKSVIIQDVIRINRYSEFFNLDSTHEMIINLLFIYVQFTRTEYRQGMHEILTSIMFVVHQEYTNLTKENNSKPLEPTLNFRDEFISKMVSLDFLEHDTFTIFQAVMESMQEWFGTTKIKEKSFNRRLSCPTLNGMIIKNLLTTNPRLFLEEDQFIESKIIHKINFITNVVLKNNDIEIFDHLNKIDVSLCPFGIRWLRLLFTRELSFPDCLILWDAIFATDYNDFSLVNYIFVALLTYLRDDILKMDNSGCLRLLMQPHYHLDVLEVLKTALYLQNPAIYARPSSMENSYEIISGFNHRHFSSPQRTLTEKRNNSFNRHKNNNSNHVRALKNHHQNEFNPKKILNKLELDLPRSEKSKRIDHPLKLYSMQQMHHNVDLVIHTYIKKITELQDENDLLRKQLNEVEDLCNRSSLKINANITILQEGILKSDDLCDDDSTLLAIAGLKQVRDQLNPVYNFEEEEDALGRQNEEQIKYRKNQQHQMVQTLMEPARCSSEDLVDGNDNKKAPSLKRRLSLFLTKSSQLNDDLKANENSQSIGSRLRSFSLLNSSGTSDFLNIGSLINSKTKSTASIPNIDNYSSLDENYYLDLKNSKLVLNDEKKQLLDNN
ncbi:TBC1 domain family member 5-like isoform X2 [Brachionus plicatilis]|uniref:TBC1 domain family member 5-like isoform X2 n=1 Tax=Brachionus plicatilis TaxID=10195 RepID=A0A3M7RXW1_BRAPC|nr:TBC1 domain family member 5-like isoform X2 [Brachionus plicatilis]